MLKGKKVVIIGGTSGMGLEVAKQVLAQGGEAVVVGRHADRVQHVVKQLGAAAKGHTAHIGDAEELRAVFYQTGPIDHLVTTAANLVFKPFSEVSAEELQRGLTSKLIGPFLAVQQALPHLSKQGSVVFFSGLAAYRPSAGSSVVAAANAGLEGLAKALAVELAPIRVNVVSPGVVDTPLWDSLHPLERQGFYQSVANHLLVRRIGQPAEVAQAAVFAMTNGFVTGSVFHVDGGGRLS